MLSVGYETNEEIYPYFNLECHELAIKKKGLFHYNKSLIFRDRRITEYEMNNIGKNLLE